MSTHDTRTPAHAAAGRARPGLTAALAVAALASTACEGQPIADEVAEAICDAIPITAEHRVEPGRYRIEAETGNSALAGLCPMSDFSIARGRDALFAFTAPHGGRYAFRKVGRGTMVSLHAGCDRDPAPLACAPSPHYHDPGLGSNPLGVEYTLEAGESVVIQVDGYGGIDWPERLGLQILGPVPAGGACGDWICEDDDYCHSPSCAHGAECYEGTCQIAPPPGDVGAACDGLARCLDDLYCAADGECAVRPAPVLLDGWAHLRDGTVHVSLTVDDPGRLTAGSQVHIGEASGGWGNAQNPTIVEFSRAVDPVPATVTLVARDGRIWFEVPVIDQPVLAPDDRCAPGSEAARCPEGTLCAGGDGARCRPVEVALLTHDREPDQVALVLRGADLSEYGWLAAPGFAAQADADGARWVGWADRTDGPVDVRAGRDGHLIAAAVLPAPAPVRADREACDPARAEDQCVAGSACIGAICRPSSPPVIDEAVIVQSRVGPEGWTHSAIRVRGRDPQGDVTGFYIDRRGGLFVANGVDRELDDPWTARHITTDGELFEAWFSGPVAFRRDQPLVVIDGEGLESAPFEAEWQRPDEQAAVGEGALCDPRGLLLPCADDLICDQTDGVDGPPRCVAVEPACPEALAPALVVDEAGWFGEEGAGLQTRVGCGWPHNPAADHYFSFVAPADGRYHVTAETEVSGWLFGAAVRRGCLQRRSERACSGELYRTNAAGIGGHGSGTRFVFEAEAGETLTVVLDADGPGFVIVEQF